MAGPDPHPDMALARRALEGNEAAWREIYARTRERLFALLVYQIGNRDEALDLLQDTYLHAVRGLAGYRGTGSLEGWLIGIAIRRALGWKRRMLGRFRRTETLEGEWQLGESEPGPDPDEGRRLNAALARLPARQRAAVLLHEWAGYSFREIGEVLGTSEATARVHAFRGREALRTDLAGDPTATPVIRIQEERP